MAAWLQCNRQTHSGQILKDLFYSTSFQLNSHLKNLLDFSEPDKGMGRSVPQNPSWREVPSGNASLQATAWIRSSCHCFSDGYCSRHPAVLFLVFSLFLSFCQNNANGVICPLPWCGSCHLAGQVGSQLGWPITSISSYEVLVTQIWDWDIIITLLFGKIFYFSKPISQPI